MTSDPDLNPQTLLRADKCPRFDSEIYRLFIVSDAETFLKERSKNRRRKVGRHQTRFFFPGSVENVAGLWRIELRIIRNSRDEHAERHFKQNSAPSGVPDAATGSTSCRSTEWAWPVVGPRFT